MAIRGDDPLKIMQRAGHEDFRTTQGYIREAEAIREGFGAVFPPLPQGLLGSGVSSEFRQNGAQVVEIFVEAPGIEPPEDAHDPQVSAGFRQIEGEPNMQIATPKCAEGRSADDSLTKSAGTRKRLLLRLADELRALIDVDDLEAARVVHEAMGRLVGRAGTESGAVADLAVARARREGGGTR